MKKIDIHFNSLEEIPNKIEVFLPENSNLIDKIKIINKYANLKCNHWICHDCFSTDYAELEYEIVCLDCGTIDEPKLWANAVYKSPICGMHYGLLDTHNIVIDISLNTFHELAQKNKIPNDIIVKMKQDYKKLEKKFDSMMDIHKRKNFFMTKIVLQRLIDHYGLNIEITKKTNTVKQQYKIFELINWLT